jgi:PAS domain S-box-containing protein
LGYTSDELAATSASYLSLLHPDFHDLSLEAGRAAMEQGAQFDLEVQMRTKSHGYRWFRTRAKVHFDHQGKACRMSGATQDIHDRKLAQQEVQNINARFSIAAESAGIGVWEWDLKTQTLSWDSQMYRLYGHTESAENSALAILMQSLHIADKDRFESALRETIVSKHPFEGDYRIVWPNGDVRHIRAVARTVIGPDDKVMQLIGVNFDITAIKLAQESLLASEAFLDRAGRIAGVGGWRVDLVKQKITWSKVTQTIHEVPDDYEPQLDQAINFYAPEARPVIENAVNEGVTNGTPWDLELPLITAKGRRIWVRAVGEVEFADGKPVALVGAFQDISERRLREADSILITKANVLEGDGPEIVFTNPTFERMTGYSEVEVLGKTPRLLQGPDTNHVELARIKAAMVSGLSVRSELLNYTKDQLPYWIEVDISPIKSAVGDITHFVAVERDITERRAKDSALRDAVLRAEQASASKGQFLANMSHEIRTPMNAIIGMLSLLHHTDLTPQQLDYADKSQNAAHSLLGLINDILDFSKVEAGKMTLDPQPFRLDKLMRDLAVILSTNVGTKGIEVLYDIDQNVPPVLMGDAMRLQQIFINLGGNAVKFTTQGQVVIAVRVALLGQNSVALQFSVKDSGIGIAPENQARIFAGFSQAEASTTRKFGGTGLGLAISKRMIEIMGGELTLSSALGEGSTFSFTLELPLVEEVPLELQMQSRLSVEPRRVLVIDDNPVACGLTARMSQSWNWPTDAVHSGEDALDLIKTRSIAGAFPFDVIYVDWHMAGIDGWETAGRAQWFPG